MSAGPTEQTLDANARHMQTEKRRRDRISNGFDALRDLLPNQEQRMDKATFLKEVVSYIRQLQVTVQEIMKHGGLASLPEEVQWQVRLLLPRQADQVSVNVREGSEPEDATPRCAELPANMEMEQTAQQAGSTEAAAINTLARQLQQGGSIPSVQEEQNSDSQLRISQLQQMLRELQSQQAASSQQLQMQQAALMQSQVFNALKLQQLVQQPSGLPLQPGVSLDIFPQTSSHLQPFQVGAQQQAGAFPTPQHNPAFPWNANQNGGVHQATRDTNNIESNDPKEPVIRTSCEQPSHADVDISPDRKQADDDPDVPAPADTIKGEQADDSTSDSKSGGVVTT